MEVLNHHRDAEIHRTEADRLAADASVPIGLGFFGYGISLASNWAGNFQEAVQNVLRWRDVVGDANLLVIALHLDWARALTLGGKGDYDEALSSLVEIVATCERIGEVAVRARSLNTLGWIHGELQDHEEAIRLNARGLEVARQEAEPEKESNALLNWADSLMALGCLEEAETHLKQVEDVVRDPRPQDRWMLWRYSQHLFHSYGELWLAREDAERALTYADECLSLAEGSDSKKNIVKARRLRGQVFLGQRDVAKAEPELATALDIAQQIGNPPQLWKTYIAIGDLREAQGQEAAARLAYREALAIIDSVAASLSDDQLRETFLGSDHVRSIRRLASSSA